MSKIKTHLITATDTIESICNQYACSQEELKKLNPTLTNKLIIGHILYIEVSSITINNEVISLYNHIVFITRNAYISYINKFNDYILIENNLFKLYFNLSKELIKNTNDQSLFYVYSKNIYQLLLKFIDYLLEQNEENIKTIKESLQKIILNIYTLLNNNKYNIELKNISKPIESNMLIIAKILNNNYYESYEIAKKECKTHSSL